MAGRMQKLPPLKSVRYCLVAAQALSFKEASEQLFVTQAAISQHIKILEEYLGRQLFLRGKRQVQLTEDGKRLLPDIQQGFDAFIRGVGRLQADTNANVLNITVIESFSSRWLVPKLAEFQQQHANISVRLQPSNALISFENTDLDLAIRLGEGKYSGLDSHFLMNDRFCLVCHPSLVNAGLSPQNLNLLPMLEENSHDIRAAWQNFFSTHNISGENYKKALSVENSSVTIVEAALAGQGIAMVRYSLIYQQLRREQLVQLFDYMYPCSYAYYLVAPKHHFMRQKVLQFEQWLKKEMLEIQ
jgi:LysR family glycine cleavage system transcriptional activator